LEKEKENNTSEENDDGEEKKDPEKLHEDILEKPLVVSCTGVLCTVYC